MEDRLVRESSENPAIPRLLISPRSKKTDLNLIE